MTTSGMPKRNHEISTLIFIKDEKQKLLLLKRSNAPNKGKWSPIGGKLKTGIGESPFECAIRETYEETGLNICEKDLRIFGCVTEKNYEGASHWLMFLFNCLKPINFIPVRNDEGYFSTFYRSEVEDLEIPKYDKTLVWDLYDNYSDRGFVSMKAECIDNNDMISFIEQCSSL